MVSLIFYGHKYTSLDELKLLYNIEFVSTDTQNAYDDSDTICSDPSLEEVTAYVPLLLEEYSCYPSSLFEERANGFSLVQKIILVKELKHEGHERNGVAYASYILRDEQPTSWTGVIRYDVEKNNTASLRRTVNHELFHLMDRMSYLPGDAHDDPEWAALNPPSFSYSGDKGASGTHVDTLYGFYSAYGQSSAIEDKATIYQLVVAEPKHLLEHYNRDDIYKVKVELIKKRLQAFWPAMDYMFWKYVNERVIRVR